LELIRNVIRHTSTSFSRQFSASKVVPRINSGSQETATGTSVGSGDDWSECSSLRSISSDPASPTDAKVAHEQSCTTSGLNSITTNDGLRRLAVIPSARIARAQAVIVVGPPGLVFVENLKPRL
jgi:hypothetical protein